MTMHISEGGMVELLRAIYARPAGPGAMLNLIRASEVRGAADISALADIVREPRLQLDLARHAADEARHAYMLGRRMSELAFAPRRVPEAVDRTEALVGLLSRDPKATYQARQEFSQEETMETLVATLIAEEDAVPRIELNYSVLASDPRTQVVLGSILKDEHRHVRYLQQWVEYFGRHLSTRMVAAVRERFEVEFERLNLRLYGALEDYLQRADEACLHVAVA